MPLEIISADITRIHCDAIVNAANSSLLGGGGVDGAIHAAAGPELLEECRSLGGCPTGEARITGGYRLPCRYVIHTVGPIWSGGGRGEPELLDSCYTQSLRLAAEHGCQSVAFPLISSGIYGYPKDLAMHAAVAAIKRFLLESDGDMHVILTILGGAVHYALRGGLSALSDRINSLTAPRLENRFFCEPSAAPACGSAAIRPKNSRKESAREDSCDLEAEFLCPAAVSPELSRAVSSLDESFSQMLLRKIDEKGMTDAQCYKRANIDRKLFSKIRGDAGYRPSKPTAMAFAIALELPIEEAAELLMKAGFAFSHSSRFDIIVEYFIQNGRYDIFEINEALFAFDQTLLGA